MTPKPLRPPTRMLARTPMATPGLRVGLLGGTFDPAHEGHLASSETVLRRLDLDRVWWLVTPGNPLKSHTSLTPLEQRLACARALARHPAIEVASFESDLKTTYTADVVAFLKARFPGTHFVWIMGGDNLAGFHRWRHWRHIAETMPIAVVDRPGWRYRALSSPAAQALARYRLLDEEAALLATAKPPAWIYLSNRLLPHSSTAIRLRLKAKHPRSGQQEAVPESDGGELGIAERRGRRYRFSAREQ